MADAIYGDDGAIDKTIPSLSPDLDAAPPDSAGDTPADPAASPAMWLGPTIAGDAPLIEAAGLLHSGTNLAVFCRADGTLAGVVTKTDVVDQIRQCQGDSRTCALSTVMSRDMLLCRSGDPLPEHWASMKARGFKNVSFVDRESRPVGVITAREQ